MRWIPGVLALSAAICGAAGADVFTSVDWLLHRGTQTRAGINSDPGLSTGKKLGPVWVWPATRDLPAELVVDNTTLPPPAANATGQQFEVAGSWTYPAVADRAYGAWPPSDSVTTKLNDYVYARAVTNADLKSLGAAALAKLPNIGTDAVSAALYKQVHDALKASTVYARWTMGTQYPAGTKQGAIAVGATPLQKNTRYAVYLRFPSSGTTDNGVVRPNVDHAMVRVSWGADADDPVTSRIFMVDMGATGGTWTRIRTASGDDRYFPYDGTSPIRVTLYADTPDDVTDTTGFTVPPIVAADAIRLVPEALRGDVHAPAVSAAFTPDSGTPAGTTSMQLSYFGRDETAGPSILFPTIALHTAATGFTSTALDPTKVSSDAANPICADVTSSIRSAVFYCLEDDVNASSPISGRYGKLRWRYVAQSTPVKRTTLDDADASFTAAGWTQVLDPTATAYQAYGTSYYLTPATTITSPATDLVARWTGTVYGTGTYSVMVWIPAGDPSLVNSLFAHKAHYQVTTNTGVSDYYLDQRNVGDPANVGDPIPTRFGAWRVLATGVRFASTTAVVELLSGSDADATAGRIVVADAVQFVNESQTTNSVVASPLLADVTWPSGTARKVVYFGTTDGHMWALDALGVGGKSTLTSAFWVYPSISNPDPADDLNGDGIYQAPQDDPNYFADPANNRPSQGIDGDLSPNRHPSRSVYSIVHAAPALGAFTSSPVYVEVDRGGTRIPYIAVGNDNGRLYLLSATGRVNTNAVLGTVNEPFPATIATADNPGVPGTTRRQGTWPTLARDRWMKGGGLINSKSFESYSSDPAKTSFSASLTTPKQDATFLTDRVIAGAGDGHVYAVDIQSIDPKVRMSNETKDGAPLWQFPEATTQISAINGPGVLTTSGKFIFSAGGRVYAIHTPPAQDGSGKLRPDWTYPYATAPADTNKTNDVAAEETLFTNPAWVPGTGTAETVYVANKDGRVFSLDASPTTNPTTGPTKNWETSSRGTTRSSVTAIAGLAPQARYVTGAITPVPALLLPNDSGSMLGYRQDTGKVIWAVSEGSIGSVPLGATLATGGTTILNYPTSTAWRGADAITANTWVYNGDEGNQDTGEMNGQMRAYWRTEAGGLGMITPDEPIVDWDTYDDTKVSLRMVELWDSTKDTPTPANPVWDKFGATTGAVSPITEWKNGHEKANNVGSVLVYEWGDTIYAAAWGTVSTANGTNPALPTVTFRLFGSGQTRPPLTVGSSLDTAAPVAPADTVAWVAKIAFPLGRGSEADAQTPGRRYSVFAQAQLTTASAAILPTLSLAAGQALVTKAQSPYVDVSGVDENAPPVNTKREMTIAHPLALSSRGPITATAVGTANPNIVGDVATPSDAAGLQETLANGNARYNPPSGTPTLKPVVAPVGFVGNGGSATYLGVDGSGNRTSALYIADRSNLYKINQVLNNIRVERREMRWSYDRGMANPLAANTGNVMNPLPWETFPTTVPNVSSDYPDVDRTRAAFRLGSGVDLSLRGGSLPNAWDKDTSTKRLSWTSVDLTVTMPRFQPANVNQAYADINGNSARMTAPMVTTSGVSQTAGAYSPSAGYVGDVLVFIDTNNDGRYEGTGTQAVAQQGATPAREEVFRQLQFGACVPPDLGISVDEQTVDVGKLPHGAGSTPNIPYAPNSMGPFLTVSSPWDQQGINGFFAPLTIRNTGNVNLVDMRVAKAYGNATAVASTPNAWVRLTSDQVNPLLATYTAGGALVPSLANWQMNSPINALPFARPYGGSAGAGNIGVVSSLDHANGLGAYAFEIDYSVAPISGSNLWPYAAPGGNPYVVGPIDQTVWPGWPAGANQKPTLHKARPNDGAGTVMSIPDVAYGDPERLLSTIKATGREVRPKIGVAPPMGTPAGTYSARMYVYEDSYPDQWRAWVAEYAAANNVPNPLALAVNGDGVLNAPVSASGAPAGPAVEAASKSPFTLKVTVREARLTNAVSSVAVPGKPVVQSDGTMPQVDIRAQGSNGGNPAGLPYGVNLMPSAIRDRRTGAMVLAWVSDRRNGGLSAPTAQENPWSLFMTQLNGTQANLAFGGVYYDWRFETVSGASQQWWNPLAAQARYPDPSTATALFPADASAGVAAVPGVVRLNAAGDPLVTHSSPSLVEAIGNTTGRLWMFWQGSTYKQASGTDPQSAALDTRTFYVPVTLQGGRYVPDTSVNGGQPYSFRSDPALPRFGTRALVVDNLGFIFWYGGPQGRSRLYYNVSGPNLAVAGAWGPDRSLPTPGGVVGLSDPVPVPRRLAGDGATVTDIDLIYTGQLKYRKQPELFLTRYNLFRLRLGTPSRAVDLLPRVVDEVLVRDGALQTWVARDIAWSYRDATTGNFVDAGGVPLIAIKVNGTRVSSDVPTFDNATGYLVYGSTLGGQIVVDPQAGTVTFPHVAPGQSDVVTATYIPQTLRLSVSRDDNGAVTIPAGWASDAAFAPRAHTAVPGANTGAFSFIDNAINPAVALYGTDIVRPGSQASAPATVSRMWVLYRKTGSNVTSSGAVYYKPMRLMVRMPRAALRTLTGGVPVVGANVAVSGNRGPVEIDWTRGRLYFTEVDEGALVTVSWTYSTSSPAFTDTYRVSWRDEAPAATQGGAETTAEAPLPSDALVNEGQICAFKDPFQDKVWVYWSSTRSGTTDLYYMAISPSFYPVIAQ